MSCNPQTGGKETGSTAKSTTSTRANGNTQAPIGSAPSSASSAAAPKSAPTQNRTREPPEPTGNTMQEGNYDFLGDVGTNAEDLQKCFDRYEAAIKGFPQNETRSAPAPPQRMRGCGRYESQTRVSRRVRLGVEGIGARGGLNDGRGHPYGGEGSQGHSGGGRNWGSYGGGGNG